MHSQPQPSETQRAESRRRHLVAQSRTTYVSPYGTVSVPTSKSAAAAAPSSSSSRQTTIHRTQPSALRRDTAPSSRHPSANAAAPQSSSSRGGSVATLTSARPKSPTRSATHPRSSPGAATRAAAQGSSVPTLTMSDLTAATARSTTGQRESSGRATGGGAARVKKSPVPEQTTVRVGALIVNRSSLTPRLEQPSAAESTSSVSSPYTASPVGSPHLSQSSPFSPNALTVHEPCDLFDLHHTLQHRLVEELGWSLHWYLDTETEIHELELAKELEERATSTNVGAAAAVTDCAALDAGLSSLESGGGAAVTPRHSDPTTPQSHRVDAKGRQLPYAKQKSQFGVMATRVECALCHELASVRRSAFAFTPRSRLSRSPYEYRLASLRRWLRKRSSESAEDALLASCISVVTQRYLAYLGFADCWTSLFVTAGLPVMTPVAATTSPTASREKAGRFPASLSAPTRFDRVPLSFYVLPALCRWRAVKPGKVEKMLRTAAAHPFPLSACFPDLAEPAADENDGAEKGAAVESAAGAAAAKLTFFALQLQSHLPDKKRSSSRRNQMASLGESCACDVYLVASSSSAAKMAPGVAASDEALAVASVWGYVKSTAAFRAHRAPSAATDAPSTDELFYIASSLENYLRLGIVFGWVYGWQLCFSTVGPPPNSVPWLRWINASAYEAAAAANADVCP